MSKTQFIYGIHSVRALLKRAPSQIIECFIQNDRDDKAIREIVSLAEQSNVVLHHVDLKALQRKVGDAVHQGIVANVFVSENLTEADLFALLDRLDHSAFLLILDQVQDPHNLGACLRSADAFGVDAVIVPKDHAASLTPVARKVASGAAETVPFIQVTNLARVMKQLKERNIWIYGAAGEAEKSLYEVDLSGSVAIAMGAEGKGLRRLTKDNCDMLLKIPMCGSVESLNVSVATGIFLSEVAR